MKSKIDKEIKDTWDSLDRRQKRRLHFLFGVITGAAIVLVLTLGYNLWIVS